MTLDELLTPASEREMSRQLSAAEEAAVLRSVGSQQARVSTQPAVSTGQNIMSVVSRVQVTVDNDPDSPHVLIVKRPLPSPERRAMFQCDAAFANEADFYQHLLPPMLARCPLAFTPCLLAAPDLIVLRDLGQDGFRMHERRRGLDLAHCELVLRELGRYHAVSYAMKETDPEGFSKLRTIPKEVFITKDFALFDHCVDHSVNMALKYASNLDPSVASRMRGICGNGLKMLTPLVTPSEPLAVICHGDFWNNNLLFRYSGDDAPQDVRFVDLQGCRYASPALDILYFLFSSSQPGITRNHLNHLIGVYHAALTDNLKVLAPSAKTIPLEHFQDEVGKHALYGLVMTLMVLPTITMDDLTYDLNTVTEDAFRKTEWQEEFQQSIATPEYTRRVDELISFCAEKQFI